MQCQWLSDGRLCVSENQYSRTLDISWVFVYLEIVLSTCVIDCHDGIVFASFICLLVTVWFVILLSPHLHVRVFVSVRKRGCMYLCVPLFACLLACLSPSSSAYVRLCQRVRVSISIYIYIHICVYVCMIVVPVLGSIARKPAPTSCRCKKQFSRCAISNDNCFSSLRRPMEASRHSSHSFEY